MPCALSLRARDALDGLADRVEDPHRVEHRPEDDDGDQGHDRQADGQQERQLHDRPGVDPGQDEAGLARPGHRRRRGRRPARRRRRGREASSRSAGCRRAHWPRCGALGRAHSSVPSSPGVSATSVSVASPSGCSIGAASSESSESSAASARSALRAMATTVSSSPKEMNRTPMVTRPVGLTSPTATRVTPPLALIEKTSSVSSTTTAPTRDPRASENFIAWVP